MKNIEDYFQLLRSFSHDTPVAIDRCHNLFLFGALVSKKPRNVCEIGIGTAYITQTIIYALRYNGLGNLTCVDNLEDWKGQVPEGMELFGKSGVNMQVPVEEEQFVRNCPSDEYDFLISDGDHTNSGNWIDEHLRICTDKAFLFFHDTNNLELFPNMKKILMRVQALNLFHYHFTESSREDEQAERGWLFVINKK